MRIESLINPALPQQILNGPPDHNDDLTGNDGLSDKNLALSDKTKWLLKKKEHPSKNEAALVTISGHDLNKNTRDQTLVSVGYNFMGRSVVFDRCPIFLHCNSGDGYRIYC